MLPLLLLTCVLGVAFWNGANDVSKGIATLVGSGVARFRGAVIWGVAWTAVGGLAATFAAHGLVQAFTGGGIIARLPTDAAFLFGVPAGALAWIALATRTGLPVSTTHAIIGALIGAGLASAGAKGINWQPLGQRFLLPLALSPLLSLALVFAAFPLLNGAFGWLRHYCVCVKSGALGLTFQRDGSAALASAPALIVSESESCECAAPAVRQLNLMDAMHWLTAGATSFARGLNDTPKIVALGIAASATLAIPAGAGFVLVTIAMALGGLLAGLRVTETLARKVTAMSPGEGFAANLVTSLLVIAASWFALPVSTTHVSSGAIIGLGLHRRGEGVRWRTVFEMALAWLVTLPVAAVIAAAVYLLLRRVG
jgi:PiT family inorganic phosphate transporter